MFIVGSIFSIQAFLYQYFEIFLVNDLYIKAKKNPSCWKRNIFGNTYLHMQLQKNKVL